MTPRRDGPSETSKSAAKLIAQAPKGSSQLLGHQQTCAPQHGRPKNGITEPAGSGRRERAEQYVVGPRNSSSRVPPMDNAHLASVE